MTWLGPEWIVGVPQSGKTTLALARAAELSLERKVPCLVIDAGGVRQLAGVPEVPVSKAAECLWPAKGERKDCRVIPRDMEETDRLARACEAGKDVVVLVDEAHQWLSARSGNSPALLRLMRKCQHARLNLLLTTQHLTGDIPQGALSCDPALSIFRCTSPAVLRVLEQTYGLDPERIRSLDRGQYVHRMPGFASSS